MRTTLQVTTPPAAEPVTATQARQHCRIDNASDDELLTGLIVAARMMAEGYLSRALLTQTLLWTMRPESMLRADRTRLHGLLRLPRAPVQSIESVVVTDRFGNVTTIAPATLPVPQNTALRGYIADLDLEPASLRIGGETPLVDGSLLHWASLEHVQISFVAGYGTDAARVPETIRQAILLNVAFLYEHRGDAGGEMPLAAQWLLDHDRLQFLGGQ